MKKRLAWLLAICLLIPAGFAEEEDYTVSYDGIKTGSVNARASVHDPSVIAADGLYYIFGSHMVGAKSDNLRNWSRIGNGYEPDNRIWGNLFAEGSHVFDWAGLGTSLNPTDDGGCHVWAPDVVWNPVMGKYMMYYCTTSTWCISNLCFGLSDSVEGPYEWQAALICSGFDKNTVSATDVGAYADEAWVKKHYLTLAGGYNYKECPNAIDPSIFFDGDGRFWMVYGSWSGGIFLLELDPATGLVIHPEADEANGVDPYFGKRLLGGGHQSIEGPYILRDEASGWYYLFVSYGALNRDGGYQIRVFRSDRPDGDYTDMNGGKPGKSAHALFGLKLSGNYMLPSLRTAYMATGHNSAFVDADGRRYIVYHSRFANGGEGHLPMVKQFGLNAEGWPCMLPYATRQEDLSEPVTDPVGRWYVIDQGTAISAEIAEPEIFYLRADGTLGAAAHEGSWQAEDGGNLMRITIDGTEFSGVFCRMQDDGGTAVDVFSAVGANRSVWGVKYDE